MNFTPEQLTKAKTAKSVEELLALAKENGLDLTEEEAKNHFEQWHKEGELADEELDNVAGGSQCINGRSYSDDYPYYLITTIGNSCDNFFRVADGGNTCPYCFYCDGAYPMYCKCRTAKHDPYNNGIGNGFFF